jgi:hypothetical protein
MVLRQRTISARLSRDEPPADQYTLVIDMNETLKPQGRRFSCPDTAKLAARALIKHGLNATQAALELRGHLTAESARTVGNRMMKTPQVLAELEKQMSPRGLDEKSKDRYVQLLWDWLEGTDKMKAQTAARILGKGFISERISVEAPEELRIEGWDEGIKMLLGSAPKRTASSD